MPQTYKTTMPLSNFRLLIHHHALAFVDKQGGIWLPAFVGRWVDALAEHVGEIGLLFRESHAKTALQDEQIKNSNVGLIGLGTPNNKREFLMGMPQLRRVCAEAGSMADGLLIRGITPRQYPVWKSTKTPRKAYLLVGTINYRHPLKLRVTDIYSAMMSFRRSREIRQMAEAGTSLLANSPALIDEIGQAYQYEASFVPTNSIRRSEFEPLRINEINPTPQLLYCGRLVPDKGIRELISALAILNSQNCMCQLHIVGTGSEAFCTQLSALAGQLGVQEQIVWHGQVPYGDQLFRLYQQADVFVLPSYHEGFPHVLWEAAANSCPVVTTAVGGIPGLWENETHGLLIPPRSSQAAARGITRVLSDNQLRAALIQNSYEHALRFTVEECAIKLVNTLSKVWGI